MNHESPPGNKFVQKAAREALVQYTCQKECQILMKTYLTKLKDPSTNQEQADSNDPLWGFTECVADCVDDLRKLHETEPLGSRVSS